ncbi:hypothetical protein Efla_002832 [Eimeria flavescens]
MEGGRHNSDGDCIYVGGLERPLAGDPVQRHQGAMLPLGSFITNAGSRECSFPKKLVAGRGGRGYTVEADDARLELDSTAPCGETDARACGSPAATAKKRALLNQARLRERQGARRVVQRAQRQARASGQSAAQKRLENHVCGANERVLDVRCLDAPAAQGSKGYASEFALWGGSVQGLPDWLPLPGTRMNARGEVVEWLRHARYGVGTYIDTERIGEYVECVKARGREQRKEAYGRKHMALKEKLKKNQEEWRFWSQGLGGTSFFTKRIRLPKFSREAEFIGLEYPYPAGKASLCSEQSAYVLGTVLPFNKLMPEASLSIFGTTTEMKMMLGLEGTEGGRDFVSAGKQHNFVPSEARAGGFTSRFLWARCYKTCLQIIRCMEGKQNFMEVQKCYPDHSVQQAELTHQLRVGEEQPEGPQHFRAVARLGSFDILPGGTVLGPPYGGVLRPAAELAMMQMVHDRRRGLTGPSRQSYAFRVDNLGYLGAWEAEKDKAEGGKSHMGADADLIEVGEREEDASDPGRQEVLCQVHNNKALYFGFLWVSTLLICAIPLLAKVGRRPVNSLEEIHQFVQITMKKLSKSKTVEEARQMEEEFYTADPAIRMMNQDADVAEAPELDAMDFRNEYSMMNDATGTAPILIGDKCQNNCHSLLVFIAGIPLFFPVTTRVVRNGDELLLSYGPHYWTDVHSTENDLSSTYEVFRNTLKLALSNQASVINASAKLEENRIKLEDSKADEKANSEIAQLLEGLTINKERTEQDKAFVEQLVATLRRKLQLEGRGPGILAALDKAAKSLATGHFHLLSPCLKSFSVLLQLTIEEQSGCAYEGFVFDLSVASVLTSCAQVDQIVEARTTAEKANEQLQKQMVSLQHSMAQQARRIEHMQAELRRMNVTSHKHLIQAARIVSTRSFSSQDCPYAKVTELLEIRGLSLHLTGEDIQRHERDCQAKRALQVMGILSDHIGKCNKCGWPFIKGFYDPQGEERHSWHCTADNLDISELLEEASEFGLVSGEGNLLEMYFNMLSRDSVLCMFLYELLCCLANTFARLGAKHRNRFAKWKQLQYSQHAARNHRWQRGWQEVSRAQQELNQLDRRGVELEEGEVEPGSCHTGGTLETELMAVEGRASVTAVSGGQHRGPSSCSVTGSDSGCLAAGTVGDSCSNARLSDRTAYEESKCAATYEQQGEALGSNFSSANTTNFDRQSSSECTSYSVDNDRHGWACLCGGRGCGEVAAKRLRLETEQQLGHCAVTFPPDLIRKPELTLDVSACVLAQYDADQVDGETDWVGWLLDLPVLRWRIPGETEGERRRKVEELMFDFPLLLRAVYDVCCNNCLGFELIPSVLNEGNWLGEFLETAHGCLEDVEKGSRSTPALWMARFIRAVEAAHKALDEIERRRTAVDASRLEDALALRNRLRHDLEKLRDSRVAAGLRCGPQEKGSFHDIQSEEELKIQRQIEEQSKLVKNQVPFYLGAWKKQLAAFIDDRYSEIFMGRLGRDARGELLPPSKRQGSMPAAINSTLNLLATYKDVRPRTWEKDVKGVENPRLNALCEQLKTAKEKDDVLGETLFDQAMRCWPELGRVVGIGIERAMSSMDEWPQAMSELEHSHHEKANLSRQVPEPSVALERVGQEHEPSTTFADRRVSASLYDGTVQVSLAGLFVHFFSLPSGAFLQPDGSADPATVAQKSPVGRSQGKRNGDCSRYKSSAPPLLLLHCDGRTAHTVVQRGDFAKLPKEVTDDAADGALGSSVTVFRYLLPASPIFFDPPIDVKKSGCTSSFLGHLPVGRTNNFTLDAVLRLPILATDGSGVLRTTGGRQRHYRGSKPQQLGGFIYDPLVCTTIQQDNLIRQDKQFGNSKRRGGLGRRNSFRSIEDAPAVCSLLLGARYTIPPGGDDRRIRHIELGVATRSVAAPRFQEDAEAEPFEHFFSFFKRKVTDATTERVTLKCSEVIEDDGPSHRGAGQPSMKVVPFINGEELEPMIVPNMLDFLKISSIRGLSGPSEGHPSVQVVDKALEMLYLREDPRLVLPGQRYAPHELEGKDENSQQLPQPDTRTAGNQLCLAGDDTSAEPAFDGSVNLRAVEPFPPSNGDFVVGQTKNRRTNHIDPDENSLESSTLWTETRQPQQENQLMLEGLLRARGSSNNISRMPTQTQRRAAVAFWDTSQCTQSSSRPWQQQRPAQSREQHDQVENRRQGEPVPPFIIRRSSNCQSSRPQTAGGPRHSVPRQPPGLMHSEHWPSSDQSRFAGGPRNAVKEEKSM